MLVTSTRTSTCISVTSLQLLQQPSTCISVTLAKLQQPSTDFSSTTLATDVVTLADTTDLACYSNQETNDQGVECCALNPDQRYRTDAAIPCRYFTGAKLPVPPSSIHEFSASESNIPLAVIAQFSAPRCSASSQFPPLLPNPITQYHTESE